MACCTGAFGAVHVRPFLKTYYVPLIFKEGEKKSPWKSTVQNGRSASHVKCTLSTVHSRLLFFSRAAFDTLSTEDSA